MHISYTPLWRTLVERNMREEDLRIVAGLTTNMIANMDKGKNISMETLVRICEALNGDILDVIELEQDEPNMIDFWGIGCYTKRKSYNVLLAAGEAFSVDFVSIGLWRYEVNAYFFVYALILFGSRTC